MKGRKPGLKSTVWTRRKKETVNQNRMKKKEFEKNEERLRILQDTFKRSNVQIVDVPGREEEEQEVEQIMKENFPNLAKETDFQEVQEAQRVPKKLDPRRNTPRHNISTLPMMKQERILEAARKRTQLPTKGVP